MNAGVFVAFAGVAPVENVHAAVGAVAEVDAAEPAVAEEQAVVAVFADVAGAAALEDFLICAATEVVQRVQFAAIRVGPVVAEIDHRAGVGMAAAVGVCFAVARLGPPLADVEVPVIGVHVDRLIDVLVGIDGVRHDVVRSGEDVPQVAGDRVAAEEFAVFVPVVPQAFIGPAVRTSATWRRG